MCTTTIAEAQLRHLYIRTHDGFNLEEIMSQLPLRSARYVDVSSDLRSLFQADHVVFRGPNPSITASYLAELFFL